MNHPFEINGSFGVALEYLIKNSDEETLKIWDKLRGNDWYIGTKSNRECNEYLDYERLKAKFEK